MHLLRGLFGRPNSLLPAAILPYGQSQRTELSIADNTLRCFEDIYVSPAPVARSTHLREQFMNLFVPIHSSY